MRLKLEETAVYHCIARVAGGEMLLDARCKEVLRKMIWQVAGFSGVEVLAYCVMSNHFHLLVRVPEVEGGGLEREELLRRYALLYGAGYGGPFPDPGVMRTLLEGGGEDAERWEARLRARMNDVSAFMKTLKQRFSWWYNRAHGRFGTLWAERFKSVLVEDNPHALKVVAAYIDLNPVRAGLVEDPGDFRWSSYGEATGGKARAREALANILSDGRSTTDDALADYRMVLFGKGVNGRIGEQGAIPHERVMKVLSNGGKIPAAELLRCRVRYMTDGGILGSEAFVRRWGPAGTAKGQCSATGSKHALGKLPLSDADSMMAWRRLQKRPIQ